MSKVGRTLATLGVSAFVVLVATLPALVPSHEGAPAVDSAQHAPGRAPSPPGSAGGLMFALSASADPSAAAPDGSADTPATSADASSPGRAGSADSPATSADASSLARAASAGASAPAPGASTAAPSSSPAAATGTAPDLPGGLKGTLVSDETGADLYADPGWQNSFHGQVEPASNCVARSPATMTVSGTDLDMFTPGSPSWDCVALESDAVMKPGHIWQLSEYIPAMANGLIADYPSWWMTDAAWSSEVDMAEAQDWGGNTSPQGAMCLDIHLDQGTENTSPDCVTETGGWHTYTFVWAADGAVTMYYDGTKVSPKGVTGTTATDMHMIIWNNNNGGISSTLKLAYLATWDYSG